MIHCGLATEVAAALTKVAFQVNLVNRMEIHCDPANLCSAAVARKLGYQHEATLGKRMLNADGTYRDTMIWTISQDEFVGSPAAQYDVMAFDVLGEQIL